ncbi:hypothetical protein BDZ89DRAFT_1007879 [Hymenopellis radicata]|nr:hypothetical protein BDZ89DRAFT_1007879 [Hymenopellis radicata]
MSETPLPPIPEGISELTGPLLLGHFFNWGLFGALSVQAYVYYLAFPKDRWWSKTIVATTYTIELLQTILATRDAFRNFGSGWGNMTDLDEVGWLWFSVPVMSSIISMLAQAFYAWRIWILSHRWYISASILVLSLIQGVAGIWSGISAHYVGVFSKVQTHNEAATSVWLAGTAFCDVIIAISMMFYLNQSRTGFRSTNLILAKFVRLTIETGAVCATFAVLDLTFFLVYKHNNYHLAPSIALSKLYSNSLLVVLNARVRFIGGRNVGATSDDYSLSTISTSFTFNTTTGTIPIHRINRGRGFNDASMSGASHYDENPDETEDTQSANTAIKFRPEESADQDAESLEPPSDMLTRQRPYSSRNAEPSSPIFPPS